MAAKQVRKNSDDQMEKRITMPVVLSLLLLFCGVLLLLLAADILSYESRWFWVMFFAFGAILFLIHLVDRVFWTIFPGFPLLGISAAIAVNPHSTALSFGLFFAVSSFSFWIFYLKERMKNWWALIPAGALFSLGVVLGIDMLSGITALGIFTLGLSFTFIIIPFLTKKNQWAFLPAGALAVSGMLIIAVGSSAKAVLYICSILLILIGCFLFVKNLFGKRILALIGK